MDIVLKDEKDFDSEPTIHESELENVSKNFEEPINFVSCEDFVNTIKREPLLQVCKSEDHNEDKYIFVNHFESISECEEFEEEDEEEKTKIKIISTSEKCLINKNFDDDFLKEEYPDIHVSSHTEVNVFRCFFCNHESSCGSSLQTHMLTHADSLNNACDYYKLYNKKYPFITENKVEFLKTVNFSRLTLHEKIKIKNKGRPTPDLNIEQNAKSRNKEYVRKFSPSIYNKCEWICGCEKTNALFCFPCLLFGGETQWTKSGISDLKHLPQKIEKHKQGHKHLNNIVDLSFLGKVNIAVQMDSEYQLAILKQNDLVKKNRYVLSKILDCILFCGKFELPLRGYDEGEDSKNSGVFLDLMDFSCKLDSVLDSHFRSASAFKDTSKTIQNELLDSIFKICRQNIIEEIKQAEFLAIICDETTDLNNKSQMAIVFRYEFKGKPVERFWGFFNPSSLTSESLYEILVNELNIVIPNSKDKLIAQTYDGAAALSGSKNGAQRKIKELYNNAHFIHCYAHQLNLIVEKVTSTIKEVRVFFSSLSGITSFFSNCPQRVAELKTITQQIPQISSTRWNYKSRTVNAVYERKSELIECCNALFEISKSKETGLAAIGIKRTLEDIEFLFCLELFSKIMPQVEILFAQLQSRNIDAVKAQSVIKQFTFAIEKIKKEYQFSEIITMSTGNKKRKVINESAIVEKVCNTIIEQCTERFAFTNHLEASKLFHKENLQKFRKSIPKSALLQATEAYPMLDKVKLETELSIIYNRDDFSQFDQIITLLNMITENDLEEIFSETVKLIKILITTPMASGETERCFSTLKRMKTFLQNSMLNNRLNAISMMSIENKMISSINQFHEKVIDDFASSKSQKMDFIYK